MKKKALALIFCALSLSPLAAIAQDWSSFRSTWTPFASTTGLPAGYLTIKDETTPLANQGTLTFLGAGVTCVNSVPNSATECTIPGGAGTGYQTIQDEAGALTQRTIVNFTGAGVSCVDNAGATRTDCTIAGGGAPTSAQYWVGAADGTLSAEKDLSALATGLVINTTGTPSAYGGTSCANNFVTGLSASGVATCGATVAAGSFNVQGGNIQLSGSGDAYVHTAGNTASVQQGWSSELLTLSTVSATTDTAGNLLCPNASGTLVACEIMAVLVRVTTGITTATTFDVGDTVPTLQRFAAGIAAAVNTTAVGLRHMDPATATTTATGPIQTTAGKVRITCNTTPAAGAVRITVFWRQWTAPGS